MNHLRQLREQVGCSQTEFADLLQVPHDTYRTWDSGRRPVPALIIQRARGLCDRQGGRLLPLQQLAEEFGMHVRTLRLAARDGRLVATFSTRTMFGRAIAFASRDAVVHFQRTFYRHTTRWTTRPIAAAPAVPEDFDRVLVQLRAERRLSQRELAERIGAANRAVVYQWESRKRRPSSLFWRRVVQLTEAPASPEGAPLRPRAHDEPPICVPRTPA
jgi:DNA-binding transcriptional regulator YiaG